MSKKAKTTRIICTIGMITSIVLYVAALATGRSDTATRELILFLTFFCINGLNEVMSALQSVVDWLIKLNSRYLDILEWLVKNR